MFISLFFNQFKIKNNGFIKNPKTFHQIQNQIINLYQSKISNQSLNQFKINFLEKNLSNLKQIFT